MTKLVKKLSTRIIIAVVFGLLFATTFTHIQGPCTTSIPGEDIKKCVELSKAIMHPSELLNNKQNSLVNYSETFLVVSAASYVLLSFYAAVRSQIKKS